MITSQTIYLSLLTCRDSYEPRCLAKRSLVDLSLYQQHMRTGAHRHIAEQASMSSRKLLHLARFAGHPTAGRLWPGQHGVATQLAAISNPHRETNTSTAAHLSSAAAAAARPITDAEWSEVVSVLGSMAATKNKPNAPGGWKDAYEYMPVHLQVCETSHARPSKADCTILEHCARRAGMGGVRGTPGRPVPHNPAAASLAHPWHIPKVLVILNAIRSCWHFAVSQ